MEALRESFVFHFDYIEDVPEELQATYAMYAINYARFGIEPELTDWRDVKMWNKTKERMNEEFEKYEKKCSNLKNHKKSYNAASRIDTESMSNRERLEDENSTTSVENKKSSGDTEYVSEYVSEYESENESVAPTAPTRQSPSQVQYSKILFDIFQEAGLPCANGNPVSFLMRDFANAMSYLHKTPGLEHLNSEDVIEACKNYAKVINSGQTYLTGKYSLDRFVTFKNFVDFLPANFNFENFLKKTPGGEPTKAEAKVWYERCPNCGQKQMAWLNQLQKYCCNSCGKSFTYEEAHK